MNTKKYLILFITVLSYLPVMAQLNLLGTQYYQNQYLSNPAMAGIDHGINFNGGYSKQWNGINSSPSVQFVSADGRVKKVGLGLNFYNDKAGLIKRTRLLGTYAYHLPLTANGNELHFGISAGINSERLSTEDINGEVSDVSAARFNQRGSMLDGDFGMAYTSNHLNIQLAVPNLKNFLKREDYNTANWNSFFTTVSYKFSTDSTKSAIMFEPKLVYRGIRGGNDLLDLGVNISVFSEKIQIAAIYHSTESASFGLGLKYKAFNIFSMYTTSTSALKGYANGNFEIGLGYHFTNK